MGRKIFITSFLLGLLGNIAFAQSGNFSGIPWAWYISRSSGLLAFVLLYISIFFGLSIRISFFRKIFSGVNALDLHGWISLQALIFSLVHGVILIFDKTLNFSFKDIFIPFHTSYQPYLVAAGIVGFYLMLILIVTSYVRRYLPYSVFRSLHSLNVGLYFIVFAHALYLGTDLKEGILRSAFIWVNVALALLFIYNIFLRLVLTKK